MTSPPPPSAIPVAAMARLVAEGHALPIMDGYDVIPTFYAGRWWWVPEAAVHTETYVPAPPELAGRFTRLRQRARAVDPDCGAVAR